MVWLRLAYLSLLVTSALGAVLFLGFTFRTPQRSAEASSPGPDYPRAYVLAHLSLATITFLLFTVEMFHAGGTRDGFAVVGYGLLGATLAVGIWFFSRYDRLGRPLRWRLVAAHLVLAVLTFTAMTAALPAYAPAGAQRLPVAERGHGNSAWLLYRQHRSELAHARQPG
jgi:hypothetical protein